MLAAYEQEASPTMFFTRMFQSPAQNFHNSQSVEIDIERTEEDVAIVITDLSTGVNMNTADIYTNKEFVPPIYDEAFTINAFDMIKRMAGRNPFEDPNFQANASIMFMKGMRKVERKIRRAIELQASQVLQTGIVTLINAAGTTLYTIDYKPKATHFPTVSTAWDDTSPDIAGDILSLCDVVRNDGLNDPNQVIFGDAAFEVAMSDTAFRNRFDARRADLGTISPMVMTDSGGNYRGVLDLGNFKVDVWTYGGRYKHPQTGVKTQYMDPKKVIVRASSGRLDATFGSIPMIVRPEDRVLPFLPARISRAGGAMDMTTNAWVSDDGKNLFGSVGTRPLMIPTAIDTYGCLDSDIS